MGIFSILTRKRFRAAATALAVASVGPPAAFVSSAAAQEAGDKKPAAKSSDEAVLQFADAVNFQNGGKFDLAADEYADFLKRYPDDPLAAKAWHYLGVCKLKLQKYDETIAADTKALSLGGAKFELADEAHFFLGLAHYRLGEAAADAAAKKEHMTAAAASLGTVATKFAQSKLVPQALYYNGEAHYAAGQKGEAVKAYQMLVEEHPKDVLVPDALYAMGFALEELGQAAEAGAAYDTFLKNHAKHNLVNDVYLRRGETLLAEKKFAEAAPLFAKAAEATGFDAADHALMQQASCLYETKQYDAAAQLYLSVPKRFAKSPEVALAWMNAGKALMLLAKHSEARAAFGNLADAADKEIAAEAGHLIARCLIREKKPAEAAEAAKAAAAKAAGGKWAAQLVLDQADAAFDQPDRRKESVALYLSLAEKYPQDKLAAEGQFMAAYAALQTDDTAKAVALATAFVKNHADHELAPEASAVLAEAKLLDKDYASAEKAFRELLAKHASHREAGLWKRRLGYSLLLGEKLDEAIRQFEVLLSKESIDAKDPELAAELQFWMGTALFKQQAFDKALAALKASYEAAPKGRNADRVLLLAAECHAATKNFAAAIAAAHRVAAEFPNSTLVAEATYREGNYLARGGKAQDAVAKYEQVVKASADSPFAPYALQGIGLAEIERKDYAAADKTLTALIEKYKDQQVAADARFDRATARQFLGRYQEAADDVLAYLSGKPAAERISAARHVLGLCQDRLKKPEEAVKTFQAILKDDPKYADAAGVWYELGWSLRSLKRDAEAREAFARIAKDFGETQFGPEAHYLLAEYLFAEKAYDKALVEYEAAAKNLPAGALGEKILHRMGWTFYRLKQFDKAQAAFERQIKAAPDGPLSGEGAFMLGESLFQQDKFALALPALNQALSKKLNKDFEALALLHAGQSAAQEKKWAEAIATLERMTKDHADSYYVPEALYEQGWAKRNLADDAVAAGKEADATKLYDAALELFDKAARKTTREVGARSRFMMGEVHMLRKNHREALRNYLKVAEGYPEAAADVNRWKAKAAFSLGHLYSAMKLPEDAKKWYETTIERYPTSEEAKAAKQRLNPTATGS